MSTVFIPTEKIGTLGGSWKVLKRLFSELPKFRRLLWITILLNIPVVILPQIFLWLSGEYAACTAGTACSRTLPILGFEVTLQFRTFLLLFLLSTVIRILSWAVFEIGGQWVIQDLQASMMKALTGTRTTYFDENPSGRIINRLVKDYDSVQTSAVTRIGDTLQSGLEVLAIGAMTFIASPLAALLIIPMLALFIYVQVNISPLLQRFAALKSARFGEVLHRETDLIDGGRVFNLYRAVGALSERLYRALLKFIDVHIARVQIESWARFMIASLTSVYATLAMVAVAYGLNNEQLTLVSAGAIVTVLFRLTPSCQWLTWSTSFVMESVASIRRVFEIADLPREELEERSDRPFTGTKLLKPDVIKGALEFVNYSMSYRADSPVILDDLNLNIQAGQHVGVIGRTGSGKTSIVQSLFRMVNVRAGDITVDGASIFDMDIDAAREIFGIVPQEPYLFAGNIRDNLDYDRKRTYEELNQALKTVGIAFPLEHPTSEGGRNLSLGERQLICLARVLVSGASVIVLDEPTSGLDPITDQRIHELLDTVFKQKTVVTIAHRLDTLLGYDLVIELKNGKVLRQGRPEEIIGG